MRAFQVLAAGLGTGKADNFAVRDVAVPVAGEGEIVVKVMSAASHPVDYKMAGAQGAAFISSFPFTMGTDCAGVVTEVGPGVEGVAVGDDVAGFTAVSLEGFGAFAEQCKMLGKLALPKPPAMSFDAACTLGVAFTTACASLFVTLGLEAATQDDDAPWVAVMGGSSSVGQAVVQLLASFGYKVVTTASPKNFEWLRGLGATACVDYHDSDVAESLKKATGGELVSYVLDCTGALAQAVSFVKPGGKLCSIAEFALPEHLELPENATFSFEMIGGLESPARLEVLDKIHGIFRDHVAPKLADGSFAPNPVEVLTGGLDGVLDAIRLCEKGMSAKTAVVRVAAAE